MKEVFKGVEKAIEEEGCEIDIPLSKIPAGISLAEIEKKVNSRLPEDHEILDVYVFQNSTNEPAYVKLVWCDSVHYIQKGSLK